MFFSIFALKAYAGENALEEIYLGNYPAWKVVFKWGKLRDSIHQQWNASRPWNHPSFVTKTISTPTLLYFTSFGSFFAALGILYVQTMYIKASYVCAQSWCYDIIIMLKLFPCFFERYFRLLFQEVSAKSRLSTFPGKTNVPSFLQSHWVYYPVDRSEERTWIESGREQKNTEDLVNQRIFHRGAIDWLGIMWAKL